MSLLTWVKTKISKPKQEAKNVVKVLDYNTVYKKTSFISSLRKLTLHSYSGMNHELTALSELAKTRKVNAKIITYTRNDVIIGWALLSKEQSTFGFGKSNFEPKRDGALFEVYVDPKSRRTGVASALIKKARLHAGSAHLSIAPHDTAGNEFYKKHKNYKQNRLSW